MSKEDSEFYIGYLSHAPPRTTRLLQKTVLMVFTILFIGVVVFAFAQNDFDRGVFDFFNLGQYEGVIKLNQSTPYLVTQSKDIYLIVGDGKFGAYEWAKSFSDKQIRFSAKLIQREPIKMLEVDRSSVPQEIDFQQQVQLAIGEPDIVEQGMATVRGELVDTKCFLGVMRPGAGKVHRACAIRCLSGGVPPGILLRHKNIHLSVVIVLSFSDPEYSKKISQWAGREVSARGQLKYIAGVPMLYTDQLELLD